MKTSLVATLVLSCLLTLTMLAPSGADAQSVVEVTFHPDSKLEVDGTSNRDDWTVTATEMEGVVSLDNSGDEVQITGARLTVPARQIKSGTSSIMDRLMYGALKADQHPQIVYELGSAEVVSDDGSTMQLNTRGELTIGGTSRNVNIPVAVERLADGSLNFKGQHALKMTDYDLTPPTAMFGALRTGDEVVVRFDVKTAGQ